MIDQQRLDFYIHLIDQLLANPKQGLSKIQENINLLDEDFVKLLVQVAQEAENDNDIDFANFLYVVSHEIVNQLHLSLSIPVPSPPPKVRLILQFLEIAYQSNLNRDLIYSFLEENLDQVDDEFAELFELYILDQLNRHNNNDTLNFVVFIVDLCPILAEFPLGNQENNLEIAIKGCETVIKEFLSIENDPSGWALVENSLGNFYTKRIRGNRSDNLEKAINYFTNALTVQTKENDAEGWALVQNNLANTYNQRIQGSRANNIEKAIKCCYNALEIRTKELYPEYWADTQINLANAYLYRIFGDRSQNLEQAIKCNHNALKIYTYEAFPEHWASIQSNLGGVYFYRIQDSRSENLEQAINCYQEALKVRTKEKSPYFWADTQHSLGKAYQERIEGAWINNFFKAIECYENALIIWKKDAFPEQWAMVKINLGETYRTNRLRKLEENYELAIKCYQDALKIYTVTSFPERWAMTQNDLGCAYAERIKDSKKENFNKAIKYFQATLTINNKDAYPRECAEILGNLGRVYYENEELIKAYKALKAAIKIIENLRDEIISGDQTKQKLASDFHYLYRLLVEVCLKLGYNQEALEYVERSKTRNLIELIFTRSIKNIFPDNVAVQLENIRDNIANYQQQLHGENIENSSGLVEKIKELRQQRNDLQDRYLPIGASFKLDLFQSTLDEEQIILEWYILSNYFVTFLITKNSFRILYQSQQKHINELEEWTSNYLKSYRKTNSEWKHNLQKELEKFTEL
ncbi:MAG: tetratricopeptide repeat protein [Crocosphaera sp.]